MNRWLTPLIFLALPTCATSGWPPLLWQEHPSKNNNKMYCEIDIAATESYFFSALGTLNGKSPSELKAGKVRKQF